MRKSIQNIALLSMLFVLGACETDKPDTDKDPETTPEATAFLETVQGKKFHQADALIGEFSGDGKTFTVDSSFTSLGVTGDLTFESASSDTEAIYKDKLSEEVRITLTDLGGTIVVNEITINATYEPIVIDPTPFLGIVGGQDIYIADVTDKVATFDTEGRVITILKTEVLGATGPFNFVSVSSETEATYISTVDSVTITIALVGNTGGTITGAGIDISFTYEAGVDPNEALFLTEAGDNTAYENDILLGTFDEANRNFVVSTLEGVEGDLTFESATSDKIAIYNDTADKEVEILLSNYNDKDGTTTYFTYEPSPR